MDNTHKQALRAIHELFPNAQTLELNVELELRVGGGFEQSYSVLIRQGWPHKPIVLTGTTLESLMANALATSLTLDQIRRTHAVISQANLN